MLRHVWPEVVSVRVEPPGAFDCFALFCSCFTYSGLRILTESSIGASSRLMTQADTIWPCCA